jgi:glycosyltransferase involved in cell wall biosynthesis
MLSSRSKKKGRLKIAYDARMLLHSGIGTQVRNVVRELISRREIELTLIGDEALIRTEYPGFTGDVIEWNPPIYSIRELIAFPDIREGLIQFPHYNAAPGRLNRAIVVVHDLIHLQSDEFARPQYRLYAKFLLSNIARRARQIVCVSEYTRHELISRFPAAANKSIVIHNGIDHSLFKPQSRMAVRAFRKRHSLPEGYLLCVGIGKRHKNADFVVRALAPLWKGGTLKQRLVIAGSGGRLPDYIASEIERSNTRDFIITLPFLEEAELPLMYGAAGLLIMPSLLEGFGFPVLEAMASGCPVLSSSAASLPEIGGDACVYFDPGGEGELRERLRECEGAKARRSMIERGLKRAKAFSWKKHVDALVKMYRRIES